MPARTVTRRSFLAGALSAGAGGGLTLPGRALALERGLARTIVRERWLGALAAGTHAVGLKRNADLIGLEWRAPRAARVQVRFRSGDGRLTPWAIASACGHGPEAQSPPGRVIADPLWTGGTSVIEIRCEDALQGARLHLLDVSAGVGARRRALRSGPLAREASLPLAAPVLQAGAGQPPIIARRAWAQGRATPRVAPSYGAVRLAFVHHTDSPNGYTRGEVPAMLRAIYAFHTYVNGWDDIGYNFAIDAFGRIFEARAGGIDEPVVGAHAGGYNLVSSGVAVLGSFADRRPSRAAGAALERLLAWKLALHGVPARGRVVVHVNPAGARYSRFPANAPVALPRVAGHRDADSTECPGKALYGELPDIRSAVHKLAARPSLLTLALVAAQAEGKIPPSTPVAEGAPQPSDQQLAGALTLLDGTPIAGATVLIQSRRLTRRGELVTEQTLAQATTGADGRYALGVALAPADARTVSLRALFTGTAGTAPAGSAPRAGAAVSDPLPLATSALTFGPAAPPTPAAGASRVP